MASLERVEGLQVAADVLVVPDPAGIAEASAERLAGWIKAAMDERSSVHVAMTGGSSASNLYAELLKPRWQTSLPWDRVHLWWGDERFVPSDSPDSNFGTAFRELLYDGGLRVPGQSVHPVPVDTALAEGQSIDWTAGAYLSELRTELPRRHGLPAFDVILLGVGGDGHILSTFPGSPALEAGAPLVMAIPAPDHIDPKLPRVTLNPSLLEAASHVLAMVGGASKAQIVERVLAGLRNPRALPAQLATGSNATWILDRGSAAELKEARRPL